MNFSEIRTKRLVIRGFDKKYLPDMFEYRSDPEISKYQSIKTTDFEEFKKIFANADKFGEPNNWSSLLIFLNDKLIGDIGLNFSGQDNMKVAIGYTIKKDEQMKGCGKEAVLGVIDYIFRTLHRHKITAEVDPKNIPSVKLLESIGFVCEGVSRKDFYDNGEWLDSANYSILSEDWPK